MNSAIEVDSPIRYYSYFLGVDHVGFEVRQGKVFGFRNPRERSR